MKGLLALLLVACAPACQAVEGTRIDPTPAVSNVTIFDDRGDVLLDFRADGDTILMKVAALPVEYEQFLKKNGVSELERRVTGAPGQMLFSRTGDEGGELAMFVRPTDPLPQWVSALFRPGEAEALGYVISPP